MFHPGDLDEDKLEDALEALQGLCVMCEAEPTMHDTLSLPWCDEHRVRGEFIDYGNAHDWPALEAVGYAIAHGAWFWTQVAMLSTDECVLALFVEAIGQEQPEVLAS